MSEAKDRLKTGQCPQCESERISLPDTFGDVICFDCEYGFDQDERWLERENQNERGKGKAQKPGGGSSGLGS